MAIVLVDKSRRRYCPECKKVKDLSEFWRDRTNPDCGGYQWWCIECKKGYWRSPKHRKYQMEQQEHLDLRTRLRLETLERERSELRDLRAQQLAEELAEVVAQHAGIARRDLSIYAE